MKRKVFFIVFLCELLFLVPCGLFVTPALSGATTIRVPDDYPTIQEAINAASPSDTILVASGTYYEAVEVNKSLTLIGEDPLTTTIYSSQAAVFFLFADNVSISGFTMPNCNEGVQAWYTGGHTIVNNRVLNAFRGITLFHSDNNNVSHNTVMTAHTYGIALAWSNNNTVKDNEIEYSGYEGILIEFSSNNIISSNEIATCGQGIVLTDASGNIIVENTVSRNHPVGIRTSSSSCSNRIYHNNLINNTDQTYGSGTNVWDNGYPSGGNYWSDHVCTGNPSNGSQPYIIDADNIDRYPFQDPNGWLILPDTTPPSISAPSQTPAPDNVLTNQKVAVSVNVTDAQRGVMKVILSYTITNGTSWTNTTMLYNFTSALYEALIPAFPAETHVCYRIIACDNAGNLAVNDNAGQYYCYQVTSPPIPGDVNGDGIVDISDVVIAAIAFGSMAMDDPDTPSDETSNWNPIADLNNDGLIDIVDLVIIGVNFGRTSGSP